MRHLGGAGVEADALLLQIAPHAGRRFQAEGAAAGQQNAVHLRWSRGPGSSAGVSSVPLAEPRISTPPTAPCSHRIAVQPVIASKVRNVADANARNVGESFHGWLSS